MSIYDVLCHEHYVIKACLKKSATSACASR